MRRALVIMAAVALALTACSSPSPPQATKTVTAPPAIVAAPPLDGLYILDYDGAKQIRNGQPLPTTNHADWYGFRSTCTPVGCTATETALDSNHHPMPPEDPFRPVFHWAEGQWQGGFSFAFECTYAQDLKPNGPPFPYMPGSETVSVAISMQPQPDGSYSGTSTDTTPTDACGNGGRVSTNRFVASRYGPPPPGVVADPPVPLEQHR